MALNFGQQVGPLPLGAWAAVVAGGLGIAWYSVRNQKASAAPQLVTDTSGDPGVGTGPSWTAVPPPSTSPDSTQVTIDTNEAWSVAAINYLIAQGYDPNVADSAIRKYMQSDSLSIQEYALVRFALAKLGSPPTPLPDPPAPPTSVGTPVIPVTPPPVTPPQPVISMTGRYVWVQRWPAKQSTLWGIAAVYYGNGNQWPTIYNVNKKGFVRPDNTVGEIANPNVLYPGEKLWVP